MTRHMEDTRSLPAVAILTSILVLTAVLSLTGNSLVCLAFYRNRRLRTITNSYVLSMSVIGLIAATFAFPFPAIATSLRKWLFDVNFCQFNGFLTYYVVGVCIGTLLLTAVNRYFCVVKPHIYPVLFTKKKTILSIVFAWLFTLTAGLRAVLVTPISFSWHPENLFCPLTGLKFSDNKVIASVFVTVFIALPMCIILFCYGSVYCAIR